jgi:hypothetical protein
MTETTTLTTTNNSVFSGIRAFEDAQRIAKALASSTLIPPQFQGQQGFANCLVALEIAGRMNISPFLCMQHLHIIHGRPSWSSAFIIAMVNGCGRFTPLRFEVSGEGDSLACYAVATDIKTQQELKGPTITMTMAKKEGWATKSGSKWATMPDLMIRYRAAAFWGRLFAGDLLVGLQTQEEVIDVESVKVSVGLDELNAKVQAAPVVEPEPAKPVEEPDDLF